MCARVFRPYVLADTFHVSVITHDALMFTRTRRTELLLLLWHNVPDPLEIRRISLLNGQCNHFAHVIRMILSHVLGHLFNTRCASLDLQQQLAVLVHLQIRNTNGVLPCKKYSERIVLEQKNVCN